MNSSNASRFLVTILGAALAASLVACAGSTADDAPTDTSKLEVKKTESGEATGNGKTCSWGFASSTTAAAPRGRPDTGTATGMPCTIDSKGGGTCPPSPPVDLPLPMPEPAPLPEPASYAIGEWFSSPDACNQCTCTEIGIMCTVNACAVPDPGPGPKPVPPSPPGKGCEVDGKTVPTGATFPSSDGCNTCGCSPEGYVSCTAMWCDPNESTPKK